MKKNISSFCVPSNTNIKKVYKQFNRTGLTTLIVSSKNTELLGTISGGDIRRFLLKGGNINSSIKNIYNKRPRFFYEKNFNFLKFKKLLIKNQYGLLPIVDHKNKIKKVFSWNDAFKTSEKRKRQKHKFDIVIMAGGLGTRMKPISNVLPKPLIPLKERPILDHIMSSFIQNGFKRFFLIINHHSRLIRSYFHSIKNQKSQIFFNEEKTPLGTAGGLKLLNRKKISKNFFVTNCDTIYNVDYDEIIKSHTKLSNLITVVVTKENHKIPYGVCKIDNNKISSIKEKPKITYFANTGLYVLNSKVLNLIPKNKFFDMTELISKVIKNKMKVGAFKISPKNWTDLGEIARYEKNIS